MKRLILAVLLTTFAFPSLAQSPYPPGPPPPVPALPDSARQTTYTISGSTCACAVNFQLYGDSTDVDAWIQVWVNGVRYLSTDPTFGWALSSATGPFATIPRPITDAVLTFNNAQTGTVLIVGARRPRRLTEFSENAGVPARSLNQAFNDLYAIERERWDKTSDLSGRGLFFAPGNHTGPMPQPSACGSAFLQFDSSGLNPLCSVITSAGNVTVPNSSTGNDIVTFNGTSGKQFQDSGVNLVTISSGAIFPGSIYFKSGRPWADVMAWGALCGGTDDHVAYQNALNMMSSTYAGGVVFVPPCGSSTTATITIPTNVHLVGSGPWVSNISNASLDATFIEFVGNYSSLEHFGVFGETTGSPASALVEVLGSSNTGINDNIDDCIIWGGSTALNESNSTDGTISRSFIAGGATGTVAVTSTGANHYIRDKFDDVTTSTKLTAFAQNTSSLGGLQENQLIDCDFSGIYTDSVIIDDSNNEALTIFESGVFSSPILVTGARYTIFVADEIGANISTTANMSIAGSYGISAITVSGAGTRSCAANSNITC